MADAIGTGDTVDAPDPDSTMDGVQRAPSESGPTSPAPTTLDYPELVAVERHHYVVSREIAKGGMGRVLEARDLRLGRNVAIKELLPKNRDAAKRFEREARITARLQHPGIIHVYEAGTWPGGEPFYAMPYVSGRSLDKVVAERATLADRLGLLPNVIAVADALAYAHSENVIHRDLKPANVLIGEFGETVVIDWGLAKDLGTFSDPAESLQLRMRNVEETLSGGVVGTPAYMPPEQARGEADQRADVYALGALLYKVLVGVAPYVGDSSKEILELVKTTRPTPIREREPGTPRDLVAIVEQAMARDPDDRYITASELAADLKRFQTGQLVAAHRYTTGQLFWRFVRRHRLAIGIATVALVVLVAVGALSIRRVLAEQRLAEHAAHVAEDRRDTLLTEKGRTEQVAGNAGMALLYLVATVHDRLVAGGLRFLIADASRSFQAQDQDLAVDGSHVITTAVSRDRHHIATALDTGAIRVWSGGDGTFTPIATLAFDRRIRRLVFDPTGARLAAAGDDGVVRVWALATANRGPSVELRGHTGAIWDLAWSADGSRIVTGSDDTTARVWDVTTGGVLAVIKCHAAPITSVRFSPNDQRILTASEDNTACVSRADNGWVKHHLRGHAGPVSSARWSPDGARVVTASDDGTARVWDARTSKLIVAPLRHVQGTAVNVAELSSDGTRVVTAGDDHVARVWELPDSSAEDAPPAAHLVVELTGHADNVVAVAFSDDDARIATGGFDRRAIVWDVASGQAIASFEHADVVSFVAFTNGGRRLVTGSRDGTSPIWDIAEGGAKRGEQQLDSAVHAVAAAPTRGRVAIGTDDSLVTLWDGDRTTPLHGHLGRVLAIAFTPDGQHFVTAGDDPTVVVWTATGERERAFGSFSNPVRSIAIWGDVVAVASGGRVRLWSLSNGKALVERTFGQTQFDFIAFNKRGVLAGAGPMGTVVVWDQLGRPIFTARLGGPVTALAFSPDGDSLVVAGQGELRSFRTDGDGRPVQTIPGPVGGIHAVVYGPNDLVISGGDDGIARVWDAATGKLVGTRDPHRRALTALALARDGATLWTASEDGTVTAWDVAVDTRSRAALDAFVQKYVPWHLDADDVVRPGRKRIEPDGQRQ
jgi:WD40 repeat protein/tRNA A-37 threonylcarbamoyl transferase component Bud32